MKWKQPVILLVCLAALSIWYYYFEIRQPEQQQQQITEARRFLPGKTVDDLERISIQRIPILPDDISTPDDPDYHIDLVRVEGEWELVRPVRSKGNQTIVNAVGNRLAHIKQTRIVIEEPKTLEPYGLDKPAFIVTLESQSDQVVCLFGDMNPSGDAYYAKLQGKNDVFLVSNDIYEDLILSARDFRKRTIVDANRHDITILTLEFVKEAKHLSFTLADDQNWYIENGHKALADPARIQELLGALTNQLIQNFVDDPGLKDIYGLDEPFLTIRATVNTEDFLLEIGDYADAGGKMRYGRRNKSGPVLMFNNEFFNLFRPDFFYYRSKIICRMDRYIVNKIEIESPDFVTQLVRIESGDWLMQKPAVPATDSTAVGSYLSTLTHLRATGLKPDDVPFGEPESFIRLYDDALEDEPFVTLTLGGSPEDGVGRWIKNSKENVVFRMSETDLERVFPAPDYFTFQD